MFSIEGHSNETMVGLLAGVTLLISWVMVQVAFAHYYAHEFYSRKTLIFKPHPPQVEA